MLYYRWELYYFIKYAYSIVRGRNFDNLSDTLHSILVNESMAKHFGWKEPIGKLVKFPGDTSGNYLEVVGVVKDFNQKSLYNPIAPLLLFYGPDGNIIQLKLNTSDLSKTIARAGSVWKKYFPELPFEYKFLDQDFNSQYSADQETREDLCCFFHTYNYHYLSRAAWPYCIYHATKAKRNKHTKSDGSQRNADR